MADLVNEFFGIYANAPTTFAEFLPWFVCIFIELMLVLGVFRVIALIVQSLSFARRGGK